MERTIRFSEPVDGFYEVGKDYTFPAGIADAYVEVRRVARYVDTAGTEPARRDKMIRSSDRKVRTKVLQSQS